MTSYCDREGYERQGCERHEKIMTKRNNDHGKNYNKALGLSMQAHDVVKATSALNFNKVNFSVIL
mgnify:CR=1 FL=1